MINAEDFKYSEELKNAFQYGITLPDDLHEPNDKDSYRYVFKDKLEDNHKPQYIKKPKRVIDDYNTNRLTTSGFALSCFDSEYNAISFFDDLLTNFKNARKAIGDCLSNGTISNEDGLITNPNKEGHFDLYEYKGCDLSSKFLICKEL